MMDATISREWAALQSLLDHERGALQDFIAALEEEQVTLARSPNVAALPAIVERKTALFHRLNELGRQRSAWLLRAALPDLSAALTLNGAISEGWQHIVQLAKTARRTNEMNGRLLRTRMSYNKAAFDALRYPNGTAPSLYGADGRL